MIYELDEELGKENGSLNPGTTADLTAASLFLILLSGWRP
jgi:triphosphoribosyl-dephospho-CoA synthetase